MLPEQTDGHVDDHASERVRHVPNQECGPCEGNLLAILKHRSVFMVTTRVCDKEAVHG
jgi:hypothetical protein